MTLERRLLTIALVFVAIIAAGAVGYVLIEGWSWVDASYMAIITVTTVGFGEVHPLTQAGRLFTSVLILLGVGAITYSFTALAQYVMSGELGVVLEGFWMKQRIEALRGHFIVCGYGRVGQWVCAELKREGRSLVVVEADEACSEQARARGYAAVKGDAGDDEVLRQAGIESAKGLVAAVDSDSANLYVVLTARALNQDLTIVSRADWEGTSDKLMRAGANRVISPYSMGGRRMAQMLVRPDVVDFLDQVMADESLEPFLADLEVGEGWSHETSSLGEARIWEQTGANILGMKRDGDIIVSPEPATNLSPGDILVALGTRPQLEMLAQMVHSPESP